jgi:hypothetical protein
MKEEAETKTIEKWLRIMDKPLAKKEGDKRRKRKGRGAKRRGKQLEIRDSPAGRFSVSLPFSSFRPGCPKELFGLGSTGRLGPVNLSVHVAVLNSLITCGT